MSEESGKKGVQRTYPKSQVKRWVCVFKPQGSPQSPGAHEEGRCVKSATLAPGEWKDISPVSPVATQGSMWSCWHHQTPVSFNWTGPDSCSYLHNRPWCAAASLMSKSHTLGHWVSKAWTFCPETGWFKLGVQEYMLVFLSEAVPCVSSSSAKCCRKKLVCQYMKRLIRQHTSLFLHRFAHQHKRGMLL